MAGHTGQSSQLFPDTPARNAQFLATLTGIAVVWQVDPTLDEESEPRKMWIRFTRCGLTFLYERTKDLHFWLTRRCQGFPVRGKHSLTDHLGGRLLTPIHERRRRQFVLS